MSKFHKILVIISSLIGLFLSFCLIALFFSIPVISLAIENFRTSFPWTDIVFGVFTAILCLSFIALIFLSIFSPSKSGVIIPIKDSGTLRLSKATIESTVRYSFSDVYEIGYQKVKVKLSKDPKNINICVRLSFTNSKRIAELTDSIHTKIDNAMKSSLGIEAAAINIDVLGVRQKNEVPPDSYDYDQMSRGNEE